MKLGINQIRELLLQIVDRDNPAGLGVFTNPDKVHERDRKVALRAKVQDFFFTRVLVRNDLIGHFDASLLLEFWQHLDRCPVTRTIEEDYLNLRSFIILRRFLEGPGLSKAQADRRERNSSTYHAEEFLHNGDVD